jgi:glycosyltransferase involved in cell wall biosynthesis
MTATRYSVITPVRNEAGNLARLAGVMERQRRLPESWVIVDTGSSDETLEVAEGLAARNSWIAVDHLPLGAVALRGGPVVQAFHRGLESVPASSGVVAKLDADTSFGHDYFDRLVEAFERDPQLGIAGGLGYEQARDGRWRQRHGTGFEVWGASRAYRRECLEAILPLEERMGWDTIDLVAATVRGWQTRAVPGLAFRHHRVEGERSPSRFRDYVSQGEANHYMGYRPLYLLAKTLFRSLRDPLAAGIAAGYLRAAAARAPRCADVAVRAFIRDQQRLSRLHLRAGESLRPRRVLEGGG